MAIYLSCKDYFPGVKAVLRHVESLGLGKMIGDISGSSTPCLVKQKDINEDDTVIFGAWDQSYALPLLRLKCKKAILWTSSPGQMEMSPGSVEISMFNHIMSQRNAGKIDKVYLLSKELTEYMKMKGNYPVVYFPPPFDFRLYDKFKTEVEDKIQDSVGLFIPPHSNIRKNYYNQKLALEMVQCYNHAIQVFSNDKGWVEQVGYDAMLMAVMVNLHVTHSESFCYQAAEAIALGTISLISECIQENLGLDTPFVVHNPDSPTEIASKITDILNMDTGAYREWAGIQHKFLYKTAEKNNNLLRLLLS